VANLPVLTAGVGLQEALEHRVVGPDLQSVPASLGIPPVAVVPQPLRQGFAHAGTRFRGLTCRLAQPANSSPAARVRDLSFNSGYSVRAGMPSWLPLQCRP